MWGVGVYRAVDDAVDRLAVLVQDLLDHCARAESLSGQEILKWPGDL